MESRQLRLTAANNEISTLHQVLQQSFVEQEATKGGLRRKAPRITSASIGNASKLPQQIRNSSNKRRKSASDDMNPTLIEEEGKSDLDLFKEIDTLSQ